MSILAQLRDVHNKQQIEKYQTLDTEFRAKIQELDIITNNVPKAFSQPSGTEIIDGLYTDELIATLSKDVLTGYLMEFVFPSLLYNQHYYELLNGQCVLIQENIIYIQIKMFATTPDERETH